MSDDRKIIIFDTTLRDGEQSPGASMNLSEKLEVAQALADMNVDVIEAGFPISSPGDFEAVREVANLMGPRAPASAQTVGEHDGLSPADHVVGDLIALRGLHALFFNDPLKIFHRANVEQMRFLANKAMPLRDPILRKFFRPSCTPGYPRMTSWRSCGADFFRHSAQHTRLAGRADGARICV